MKRAAPVLLAAMLLAAPAFSHLLQYTRPSGGGAPQRMRWDFSAFSVQWNLNPQRSSSISGSRSVGDVMAASFATWRGSPNAGVSISRGADSDKTTRGFDGVNLICFVCQDEFGNESGTLAITVTTVATSAGQDDRHGGSSRFAGQILDSDILFNPSQGFSTTGGSGQDLETVATHEAGHFFGLDHSAVVRAVMYPFAPDLLRTLGWDDVAGIARLYPAASAEFSTGAITGTVRLESAGPVFGAHVYAESATNASAYAGRNIRKTPVGILTAVDGSYRIEGLPPDSYIVTAEPLNLPVTDGDVDGYADAFGKGSVQTGFTTRWH